MQTSSKQHHAITTSKTIRPYTRATGMNIQVKMQYKQSNQNDKLKYFNDGRVQGKKASAPV